MEPNGHHVVESKCAFNYIFIVIIFIGRLIYMNMFSILLTGLTRYTYGFMVLLFFVLLMSLLVVLLSLLKL